MPDEVRVVMGALVKEIVHEMQTGTNLRLNSCFI